MIPNPLYHNRYREILVKLYTIDMKGEITYEDNGGNKS